MSPLRAKAKRLGLSEASSLVALAVDRGCRHYGPYVEATGAKAPRVARTDFKDEELCIALLLGSWPYDPIMIRCAAQLLGAESMRPGPLLGLAARERCACVLGYIARKGADTEPENPFWKRLLEVLPPVDSIKPGTLPHASRFRSETGMVNPKRPGVPCVQWLRPSAMR